MHFAINFDLEAQNSLSVQVFQLARASALSNPLDRGSDLTNLPNTQVGANKSTRSVINPSICHVLS